MVAQKLKNNKIAISNGVPRKDAIEVIRDLKVSEFCRLSKAAREWNESINDNRDIIFTHYENEESKICKEFNKIFARRKAFEEKLNSFNEDTSNVEKDTASDTSNNISSVVEERNYSHPIVWASRIKGTSRLIRIPKKQLIKIVRRKGLIDDNNRPSSVCIDNKMREEFFADCKKSKYFQDNKVYEIMYTEEDKEIYEKWDSTITKIYKEGLPKIASGEITVE